MDVIQELKGIDGDLLRGYRDTLQDALTDGSIIPRDDFAYVCKSVVPCVYYKGGRARLAEEIGIGRSSVSQWARNNSSPNQPTKKTVFNQIITEINRQLKVA